MIKTYLNHLNHNSILTLQIFCLSKNIYLMLKYAVALKKQQDNFIHAYPPFNILLKLSRSYLQIIMGTIQVLKVQPVL